MTGYPLAVVVALRAREVAAASVDLAHAVDVAEARRADLERQGALVLAHAARVAEEAGRIAAGQGAGSGLLPARARFTARLRGDLATLAGLRGDLERTWAAAERAVELRRDALSAARGRLRALEAHREGWSAAETRRRDRDEQDAAEDLVSARRAGP